MALVDNYVHNGVKKVSIIITVYNGAEYLKDCLNSVIAQTFDSFRLILVDDGSTDDSGIIADEYSKLYSSIITVIHQANGGISNARNTGISYVDTEFIAFVDADDKLLADYIEKLYNAAVQNNADCIVCGYTRIDEHENILGVRRATDWQMTLDDGKNYVFSYIVWARIYRTDLITDSGMRFSNREGFEDIPFNIYMNIIAKKIVAIDYSGYLYRANSNSITEVVKKKGLSAASSVMKFPYKGLENTIIMIRHDYNCEYDNILYYEIVKNFTGLLLFVSKSSDVNDIRRISNYEENMLSKYFRDVNSKQISYFRLGRLKKLPLSYRLAVNLYMIAYKTRTVYQFALMYKYFSGIEKLQGV